MPALLLSPLARWAAVGIIIALLVAGLFWFKHEATVARESQAVAERQAAISAADAERWQKASGERDGALAQCNADKAKQNDAIEAARSDNAKLNSINSLYAAEIRNVRDAAQSHEQETRNDARQRPAEVHRLGAVACAQYRRLYGEAAACTDTSAAPGH